jgi:hypothetical protein
MKAIRTRYIGQTDRSPARWKAEDSDGNKAVVSASSSTAADAVEALCVKMGWQGTLVAGGFGGGVEFWVWDDEASPRITVKAAGVLPSGMTAEQGAVLADLRARDLFGTAEAVERHWLKGEHYYIDERVGISKSLRLRFDAINDKLLADADARFEASQKKGGE